MKTHGTVQFLGKTLTLKVAPSIFNLGVQMCRNMPGRPSDYRRFILWAMQQERRETLAKEGVLRDQEAWDKEREKRREWDKATKFKVLR